MSMRTLHDLLLHEIRDLYDAEHRILKSLPKMIKKAHSEELRQAFQEHMGQTEMHMKRLEEVLSLLDETIKKERCAGMEGLLKEGNKILTMKGAIDPDVRDAAMIAAAQRIEHYEIAAYGCARTFAKQLGYDQVAEILQQTLDEEARADQRLTEIATDRINAEAMDEDTASSEKEDAMFAARSARRR